MGDNPLCPRTKYGRINKHMCVVISRPWQSCSLPQPAYYRLDIVHIHTHTPACSLLCTCAIRGWQKSVSRKAHWSLMCAICMHSFVSPVLLSSETIWCERQIWKYKTPNQFEIMTDTNELAVSQSLRYYLLSSHVKRYSTLLLRFAVAVRRSRNQHQLLFCLKSWLYQK